MSKYLTLLSGLLSPVAAVALGLGTYLALTRASADRDADFVFRLSMTAAAMAVPFVVTVLLALRDRRQGRFGTPAKVGLVVAVVSLGLLYQPINAARKRMKQAEMLALKDVRAPGFHTVDIYGKTHQLADHEGKVVLINIWATWCPPCRKEMPDLEQLYTSRQNEGFVIFGISEEDAETQRSFAENDVSVSYPLLTVEGDLPEIYRTTARYPANYLIDRHGRLQPAPSTERPFEELVARVDALLAETQ